MAFRNLIITSAFSSVGVKVPPWLRGNTVVMIVILPRDAPALQAVKIRSPLRTLSERNIFTGFCRGTEAVGVDKYIIH